LNIKKLIIEVSVLKLSVDSFETQKMYCKNCDYMASRDGYCSFCYDKENNTDYYKSRIMKNTLENTDIDNFFLTCIHSTNQSGKETCVVCLEEKKTCSKFACLCYPVVCLECISKLSQCPICKENQYFLLTKKQIESLIRNKYNNKIIIEILNKLVKENDIKGNISVKNLITTAEVITSVFEDLDKKITLNYNDMNTIYSFAYDIWNIPEFINDKPNTAYCYKGTMNGKDTKNYNYFYNYRFNLAYINRDKFEIE
jgi:hypothetical protein